MASAKTVCDAQPHSMPTGSLPTDAQTRATSKLPVKSKEADVLKHLHPGDSDPDVTNTKASESCRDRQQEEHQEEAVNKQLHQKLTETQGELKDLTQKVELLEKFQDNCLAILESKGLNPGNKTLASQRALKVKLKLKEEERVRFLEQQTSCKDQA
ncbi:hypothetical protein A6R68_12091, partial [Neotoma lepida]